MSTAVASVGVRFLKLGAGEVLARLLSFAATVYLARTLGASVYGVLVAAMTVTMYLVFVADCGMDMLGVQEVAHHPAALPTTLPPILGARVLVAILLIAVTGVVAWTLLPRPDGPVLVMYSLTMLTVALGTRWVHLGLELPANASWARIMSEGLAALVVLVSVHGPDDLLRVPIGQVIGETVGMLFLLRMLPAVARPVRLQIRPGVVGPLVMRSWPIVLHGLLGLAIFNSDFLFLRTMRGSTEVGYYAAAYTLISFFQNLGVSYTMSLIPSITRARGDAATSRELFDGAMAQSLAGSLPVAVGGVLVASSLATFIFSATYAPSVRPLQVLLLIIPVSLFRNVAQALLVAHERQDLLLRTVAWAAAANVVLNLSLIPRWGMLGAAVATLATELARTVLALGYARGLGMPMTSPSRFVRVALAAVIMGVPVWWLSDQSVFVSIPVGGAMYLVGLVLTGGLRLRRGMLPQLVV